MCDVYFSYDTTEDDIRKAFNSLWDRTEDIHSLQQVYGNMWASRILWIDKKMNGNIDDLMYKNIFHYVTRKLLEPGAKISYNQYSLLYSLGPSEVTRNFSDSTLYEILNCLILLGGNSSLFKDSEEQFLITRKTYSYLHKILYPVYLSGAWKSYSNPNTICCPWRNSFDYAWFGYPWYIWPVIFYLRDKVYKSLSVNEASNTYPCFPQFKVTTP
jgi:hypothetical protein